MMPARLCYFVHFFTVLAGRTLNASQRKEVAPVCPQEFCWEDNNEVRAGNSWHDLHSSWRILWRSEKVLLCIALHSQWRTTWRSG